ncbi:glycosyltransferase family 90 protein [Suillus paluster]|uniref:glycosyltransferase family 90 protein n=1 Tax=Suillus paluster TaxID=48578 RepID=UPI001B86F36C|nr:glycosyltransferase family 90 protein [Suillus paluster]KAG1730274.1 glycosyltransferase family 90 protein [Suillus paluster]
MADAEEKFKGMLSRQSKTLEDAVVEYRKRYGREPPKGFGDWWQFAQENHVKLVDEFDAINEDLAPFWNMSPVEFRRRAVQVSELPSIDLIRIAGGKAETVSLDKLDGERGHRALGFMGLLAKFENKLPDMYFAINSKAEGRILVPWEHRQFPNMTLQDSSGGIATMVGDGFTSDWKGQGSVWAAYRRTCPPDTEARRLYSSYRNPNAESSKVFFGSAQAQADEITFVPTVDDSIDYCSHPWAHYSQGHFFSDWRTIPVLYPVLSPAKAAGFLDIRIPSHYYLGQSPRYTYGFDPASNDPKDVDDLELPWEEKINLIFWRGADTGGGSTPPGFASHYQRHRFLHMTHESAAGNRTIIHADPSSSDNFITTTVPARQLNAEIMDAAFVSTTGGFPGGEEALRKSHRFAPPVPLGQHWAYKYLIDLDGMGYSGRFLALLSSESAVIKSTVWREFLTDWLQPWLHYIPLSSSYAEIYNIHAYFSGPTPSTLEAANLTTTHTLRSLEGDRHLQRIARAGRQWRKTIGRTVDMEAYVYRLCLEYARLWADDRDSMNFVM